MVSASGTAELVSKAGRLSTRRRAGSECRGCREADVGGWKGRVGTRRLHGRCTSWQRLTCLASQGCRWPSMFAPSCSHPPQRPHTSWHHRSSCPSGCFGGAGRFNVRPRDPRVALVRACTWCRVQMSDQQALRGDLNKSTISPPHVFILSELRNSLKPVKTNLRHRGQHGLRGGRCARSASDRPGQ